MVKKKITKKEAKKLNIEMLEMRLNAIKDVYNDYIKVLVKYNIETTALSAIRVDDMHEKELLNFEMMESLNSCMSKINGL